MTLARGYLHEPSPSPEYATTGPDGRFQFAVPKAELGINSPSVAAAAPNLGVGWVNVPAGGKTDDLTLQLVDDDVPITGQIVDLEGKPVQGATLRVMQINAAPGEDLGPWLEAVKGKRATERLELEQRYLKRFTVAVPSASHDRRRGPLPAHRHRPQPPGHGATRRANHRQPSICTSSRGRERRSM